MYERDIKCLLLFNYRIFIAISEKYYRINSILCSKWTLLNRVRNLQHEPKASVFCEPSTSTETTRAQKAHLALGAHDIFCNTSTAFAFYKSIKWA